MIGLNIFVVLVLISVGLINVSEAALFGGSSSEKKTETDNVSAAKTVPSVNGSTTSSVKTEASIAAAEVTVDQSAGGSETISYVLEGASMGDIDGIRQALDEGENIDVVNVNGWSAAMFAVTNYDLQTLAFLIEEGIDLNQQDVNGFTPLMMAASQSDKEMITLLLDGNASPLIAAQNGMTAFSIAIDTGRKINAMLIAEASIIHGMQDGNSKAIVDNIKAGGYVNIRNVAGWNPLIYASSIGDLALVKELLTFGPDVNRADNDRWTPLHFAAFNGHEEIVSLLLKNGANPYLYNVNDRLPRDLAMSQGFPNIAAIIPQQQEEL
eukprot:gene5808-8014_t